MRDAYPPEYDGPEYCEVCLRDIYHKETECDCPECEVCGEVGRLACQTEHGLKPTRPECAHDAIRSIPDLAAVVSTYRDDAASIARRLFNDTECGISFYERPGLGVVVAGYAEGADPECWPYALDYPFTEETFWATVEKADEEGCEMWEEWNCPVRSDQ